jgi:cobalt/nickel transport system permease protein
VIPVVIEIEERLFFMHIPDGFLSPPVWATFDLVSLPAVGVIARRARHNLEGNRIPLLGVMGAFVFAAQMINFPVGPGTSGHLVGGTLLAIALGPWAAALVMTAILAIQAFVFQDGGILALGTNVFNMAVVGIFAGYLPYYVWGKSTKPITRSAAIFIGGVLSVLVSATLALSQLRVSGVPMTRHVLFVSLTFFLVSGLIEGAITVAVLRAIERLNPLWIPVPKEIGAPTLVLAGIGAFALLLGGVLLASTSPDGIEKLLAIRGVMEPAWTRRALAGMAGILGAYAACLVVGKLIQKQRGGA